MEKNVTKEKPPNRFAGKEGFKDKTVLITGGTGFLGKVLIEKILRTCFSVKRIYVLIRSKKGKNAKERIKDIFANPLFDLLKKTAGEQILNKVIAVEGDVLERNLGLSTENYEILKHEVEIIYHMAAAIQLFASFKNMVLLNVRGTKYTLELAKQCKKLMVFVYVSTAYCHLKEEILYEKAYLPPKDPDAIINIVESVNEEVVDLIANELMANYPNAYSFSKSLSEDLVNKEIDNIPAIIVRPSVVIPIWKEPLPGWTDNMRGPTGLLTAAGKGIVRTIYGNPKAYMDYIPADVAANIMMLAAFDYINHRTRRIYNLTSSFEVKITFEVLIEVARKISCSTLPLNWIVWYPGGSMTTSKVRHKMRVVFYHYIPALIVDTLLFLTGNKPILWKIQQKISKACQAIEFYSTNQWNFNCNNLLEARKLMNKTEEEIYEVYSKDFDFKRYMYNSIHAARLYILNESDETLPTARRHMKLMWALDKFIKICLIVGFIYLLLQYFVFPILHAAY